MGKQAKHDNRIVLMAFVALVACASAHDDNTTCNTQGRLDGISNKQDTFTAHTRRLS